jgi:putative oxygen-independent coproporphyrinogen III oxidase
MPRSPLGLYLHIPFCRQRCDFCAFYLEIYRTGQANTFVDSLRREIRLYGARNVAATHSVHSIYFGGGTPTTLSPDQLQSILEEIWNAFVVIPDAELSIEAHPATVSEQDLAQLARTGFNRISLGAESMDDREFAPIGRPGASQDTIRAVTMARAAGFTNINLDLMYGLPGQTLESWQWSIDRVVRLDPTHISCYALTIEEGTKLAQNIERQVTAAPDEALQVEMDEAADVLLRRAGYQRYEISNYAKPGYACRHNLLYWTNGEYLGLGPSAQSYMNGSRFGNIADLTAYDCTLSDNRLPAQAHTDLSDHEQLRDAVVFGLRLVQGIPTRELEAHALRYGHRETLMGLRAQQLIEEEGTRSKLTAKGRQYADTVAEKLF